MQRPLLQDRRRGEPQGADAERRDTAGPGATVRAARRRDEAANHRVDPAGYIVVVQDRRRGVLLAEHYENIGVLHTVIEGANAIDIMATLLTEGLVTRADHAAYLGRELALAESALRAGAPYVQDQAPDAPRTEAPTTGCGCSAEEET